MCSGILVELDPEARTVGEDQAWTNAFVLDLEEPFVIETSLLEWRVPDFE